MYTWGPRTSVEQGTCAKKGYRCRNKRGGRDSTFLIGCSRNKNDPGNEGKREHPRMQPAPQFRFCSGLKVVDAEPPSWNGATVSVRASLAPARP